MNALPDVAVAAVGRPRVALLVDGDNISADLAGRILMQALRHGDPVIRRVYGHAGHLKGWDGAPGFRLIHAGGAKNATDILLTVQAMALMLGARADVLVLASSDRDFTHLATHLRETGIRVIGMGEAKAPEGWRKACSQFHELALPRAEPAVAPVAAQSAPQVAAPASQTRDLVLALLRANGVGNWVAVTAIGQHLRQRGAPGLKASGHSTWRKFFAAELKNCDYDDVAPGHRVRLRQAGTP